MEELLTWLRTTIQAELALAKAADEAAPGPWVNSGQYGCGDAWQIHGAPTAESGTEWNEQRRDVVAAPSGVATAAYEDGGGVWKREAADHIVLHQPRDAIARCQAELALLDDYEQARVAAALIRAASLPAHMSPRERAAYGQAETSLRRAVERLAAGRRHRPGFNPAWLD